jgi:hypothetical protein
MKKLLSLLGVVGMITTTSATVVACDKDPKNSDNTNDDQDNNISPINIGETQPNGTNSADFTGTLFQGSSEEYIKSLQSIAGGKNGEKDLREQFTMIQNQIYKSAITNGWKPKMSGADYRQAWSWYTSWGEASYVDDMFTLWSKDTTEFAATYLSEDQNHTFILDITPDLDQEINGGSIYKDINGKKLSEFFSGGSITFNYTTLFTK